MVWLPAKRNPDATPLTSEKPQFSTDAETALMSRPDVVEGFQSTDAMASSLASCASQDWAPIDAFRRRVVSELDGL